MEIAAYLGNYDDFVLFYRTEHNNGAPPEPEPLPKSGALDIRGVQTGFLKIARNNGHQAAITSQDFHLRTVRCMKTAFLRNHVRIFAFLWGENFRSTPDAIAALSEAVPANLACMDFVLQHMYIDDEFAKYPLKNMTVLVRRGHMLGLVKYPYIIDHLAYHEAQKLFALVVCVADGYFRCPPQAPESLCRFLGIAAKLPLELQQHVAKSTLRATDAPLHVTEFGLEWLFGAELKQPSQPNGLVTWS